MQNEDTTDSILLVAEHYIKGGLACHPCRGKAPKVTNWQNRVLTQEEFKSYYRPGDNLGVRTGKEFNLICLDIDAKSGGLIWFEDHKLELGEYLLEETGGGGKHLFYRYPQQGAFIPSRTALFPGVDLLADGGKQVITAPSIHASGKPYSMDRWLLDLMEIAGELPQWIVEAAGKSLTYAENTTCESRDIQPNIDAAIEALKAYPSAVEGQAGDATTYGAAALMRDYGLNEPQAMAVLKAHYNHRCTPPWSDKELLQKVKHAYKYAKGVKGQALPEVQFRTEGTDLNGSAPEHRDTRESEKKSEFSVSTHLSVFKAKEFPPRQHLIGPFVRQGLAMVYAPAGVGKTHFCMGIGFAVATGGEFLKWRAETKASVLYIDGELPAYTLQERLRELARGYEGPEPDFHIITPDEQPDGVMPDLATLDGQRMVSQAVDRADLIIVDNLSTLVRTGKENEAESWLPVQAWALGLRRRGKSVIFVHHSGKGESASPRGTSRREDVLDVIIGLSHPGDYSAEQGCTFQVKFRKNRNYRVDRPGDTREFVATLVNTEFGASSWIVKDAEEHTVEKIEELLEQGYSQKAIAEKIGKTPQYVSNEVRRKGLKVQAREKRGPKDYHSPDNF